MVVCSFAVSFSERQLITPEYPLVLKVAHTHAGYGKMRIQNSEQFADARSLVAVHDDYSTVEPFIDW